MSIDTKNERLSIIGWTDGATNPEPTGTIDKADRFILVALPAVDLVPITGEGVCEKTSFGAFGYIGLGG